MSDSNTIGTPEICASEGCGAIVPPGEIRCQMCAMKKQIELLAALNKRLKSELRRLQTITNRQSQHKKGEHHENPHRIQSAARHT